jgi:hypothetical protein
LLCGVVSYCCDCHVSERSNYLTSELSNELTKECVGESDKKRRLEFVVVVGRSC